jgi:hypothetical protein
VKSLSSFLASIRRLGLRTSAWRALKMLAGALVFRRDILLVYARESPSVQAVQSRHTRWCWLTMEMLSGFKDQQDRYLSNSRLAVAQRRIDAGDRPYALLVGPQLVNLGWVRMASEIRAEPEVGRRISIPLPQPEPIIYDCWTPPEHRGSGHYPTALRDTSEALLGDHARVWIYCRVQNRASVRGIEKAEFTLQQKITRTRVLGFEWSKAVSLQAQTA